MFLAGKRNIINMRAIDKITIKVFKYNISIIMKTNEGEETRLFIIEGDLIKSMEIAQMIINTICKTIYNNKVADLKQIEEYYSSNKDINVILAV